MGEYHPDLLPRLLPTYYKELFPFKPYTRWLSYGTRPTEKLGMREFAFIFEGDAHLRYRSFACAADFERDLCKLNPHKLDLGAMYNFPPRDHKMHAEFRPVEREFVLDIDLTDYERVRTCCTEATVCDKCWKFIALAVKILDKLLADDFGFMARLWVFSGRRGVHCWVADPEARAMNNNQRQGVAEYLSMFEGTKMNVNFGSRKVVPSPLHPMVESAYRTALDSGIFEQMVHEQGWLKDARLNFIVHQFEDEKMREQIKTSLLKANEKARWEYLLTKFDEEARRKYNEANPESTVEAPKAAKNFLRWFVLYHIYPRLDVNVSTGMNHLLKSPFCIHPKTGNVAVPLNPDVITEFDVGKAPRIDQICTQLREAVKSNETPEDRKVLGYKHTSLRPYVENFERFIERAMASEKRARQEQKLKEEELKAAATATDVKAPLRTQN
ncbi:unnamed protein product, partial [Mesorhabditis spiculigera]